MIKLDKNYNIETDTTSGFKLLYKSDPIGELPTHRLWRG